MSDAPDRGALIGLVDELAKQREDEARRLQEEVPVLTEVVDGKDAPDALEAGARALADDIEREVLRQITPQIHDIVRHAVRVAVWHALVGAGRRGSDT
jgi:hypothetical protein